MRIAGRGEQRPGPGAWRSGGGLGPVGFPQVGASGGGGGLRGGEGRGGGEVVAQGQPGPGELLLLRPLLWPTPRGEARHVSRHSQGTWACPVRPLPSGLATAPGRALPGPQPALTREARPAVTPWGGFTPQPTPGFPQPVPAPSLPGGRGLSSSADIGLHGGSKGPRFPSDPAGTEPLLGNELQCLSGGVSPKSKAESAAVGEKLSVRCREHSG